MKVIITAEFKHETNRYCPGLTTMQDYKNRRAMFFGEDIYGNMKHIRNDMTCFAQFFGDKKDYCLVPAVALDTSPGAPVEQSVWQLAKEAIVAAIRSQKKVDGVLLSLHGAMVTQKFEDGEGELLEEVRREVGKDVPIMATLDLHANITEKMIANADALFAYDYYPHTDIWETGLRAAQCMYRTLQGEIRPVLRHSKLDLILPYMPHAHPVFAPFLAQAQEMRNTGEIVDVSICHGFFPADIYEQGVAVLAVADSNAALAQNTADDLGEALFAARNQLRREFLTPEQAITVAQNSDSYPVVIADVADNPGAGASCDATALLKKMIEMDVQEAAIAVMYDPETVLLAEKAGVGSQVEISLGGKVVPEMTGGPVSCKAYVKMLSDGKYRNRDKMCQGLVMNLGKSALLQIGGISVIVCSIRQQPWDLEVYRSFGIQPQDMKILVTKSTIHYRESFSNVSSVMLDVEAPALAPQCPESMPLSHSRRPIYPLDDI